MLMTVPVNAEQKQVHRQHRTAQESDSPDTVRTSGFNNNELLHVQASGTGIRHEAVHAVGRETGLASQEGIPVRAREMGLQPEGTDHTSDAESVKTGDITGSGDQIQNDLGSGESMTTQKELVNCSCYYKNPFPWSRNASRPCNGRWELRPGGPNAASQKKLRSIQRQATCRALHLGQWRHPRWHVST